MEFIITRIDGTEVYKETKVPEFGGLYSYQRFNLETLVNGIYLYKIKSISNTWSGKFEILH